ncbi:parasitophorous vacuolar protein 1, putative [Plasmodium berghei]|uniref:Parasitophorous vacuolar protein 1 n=2 Tax=Plasmodium berghei TaxID=5821 RepID=A0A509AJQ5_PLABA|nr:parasitophorous vacuolar protein 1 [Plasmodium berghei ANKA]CXI42478.1 parasitophorous vacuolar protein 1, putative [Plasmodium berghei]SCM22128.1 parasitophorous vacuolar protein 1, putative [Plasmodium berghei]SCN25291.1 parasitophorous vacuolar protein 1, putative [Plasmodium berghei]SCO60269.1 parasitophorous vacuolar protein 1, putative [Plasmodium berghei]SCO61940.1 parasitophorous vacuolar protein 1, putative [Plasmodium berghei]|eukprot:XP_034421542.1 parasitophorous vacuolar protein 1 [Plasmodium berghei ANKA]
MMIKVALAIFLSIIPAYAIKVKVGKEFIDIPDEISHMTAMYSSGAKNDSYIDAVNAVLEKPEDNYKFSITNDVHKCYFSKIDIEINDEHRPIHKLFREENKSIIEDAIRDYKLLLMLDLEKNAKKKIDLTKLPEHFQDIGVGYLSTIKPSFFHKYTHNENENSMKEGLEISYDNNELDDSKTRNNENSDLSKFNNDKPNDDKQKRSMMISSQQIIMHNGNTNGELGESENEEYYNNMNKEKALNIFMNNTNLHMTGICIALKNNENKYIGQCAAKMNKHFSSIACESHENNYLRKNQKIKELFPGMMHEQLNSRMSEMIKFFENPEEATGMLLSALSKPGLMESINSLDIASNFNFGLPHENMNPEELLNLDNSPKYDIDQDKTNLDN